MMRNIAVDCSVIIIIVVGLVAQPCRTNRQVDHLCATMRTDACKEKNEVLEKMFATISMSSTDQGVFRIVMPSKPESFLLQVVASNTGKPVGHFIDKAGNKTFSCVEFVRAWPDTVFIERDSGFHIGYKKDVNENSTTLWIGLPYDPSYCSYDCYPWKPLLDLSADDGPMGFAEIGIPSNKKDVSHSSLLNVTEGKSITETSDNPTSSQMTSEDQSSEEDSLEKSDRQRTELGQLQNGTVVNCTMGYDEEHLRRNYTATIEYGACELNQYHLSCDMISFSPGNQSQDFGDKYCTQGYACYKLNTSAIEINDTGCKIQGVHFYCMNISVAEIPSHDLAKNYTGPEPLFVDANSTMAQRIRATVENWQQNWTLNASSEWETHSDMNVTVVIFRYRDASSDQEQFFSEQYNQTTTTTVPAGDQSSMSPAGDEELTESHATDVVTDVAQQDDTGDHVSEQMVTSTTHATPNPFGDVPVNSDEGADFLT